MSQCGLAICIINVKKLILLRQKKKKKKKKNYGNSNISPCKNNIIFKKKNPPLNDKTKILQDILYNSIIITNLKFQTPAKIIIFPKILI
jgi:hypothetical protein